MSGLAGKRGWRRVALAVMAMAAAGPLALPASPVWAAGEAAEQQVGAAAAGIAVDESARLPALKTNEVTGDFLGLGHDQRAVLEDYAEGLNSSSVKLRIYNGKGDKLKETTLGLGDWNPPSGKVLVEPWVAHHKWAHKAGLTGLKIAAGKDGHLYIAGHLWSNAAYFTTQILKIDPNNMRQVKSVLLGDVTVEGDATPKKPLATSLDIGVVNGVETLAVGQSAGGVRLYGTSDLGFHGTIYEDWKRWSYMTWGRDLVTAVKFSGEGSVKTPDGNNVTGLAIGRLAYDYEDYSTHSLYMVDPSARKALWQQVESAHFGSGEIKAPTALAFDDENQRLAVSWWHEKQEDGRLEPLQVRSTLDGKMLQQSDPIRPAARLSYVKTGRNGEPHLVVGSRDAQANQVLGKGEGDRLSPIALGKEKHAGNDAELRVWFPGYRSIKLKIKNDLDSPIEARLVSNSEAEYRGCWANSGVGSLPAFPSGSFSPVEPGQQTPAYSSAVLTAGPNGTCTKPESRYSFVEIQPVGKPGLRSVVKMQYRPGDNELSLPEQIGGGALQISAESTGAAGLGEHQLVVSSAGSPLAVQAPDIAAKRLTVTSPDGDPNRPVYRFDVSGAAWQVPGADDHLTETQLPAMTAQGSTNGIVWEDLGQLKPVTSPKREGDIVALGNTAFYWENEKDAKQYTKIRVKSGEKVSQPVTLKDLPPPDALPEKIYGVKFLAPDAGGSLVHGMRSNGLDQRFFEVAISTASSDALASDHEAYQRLFYRTNPDRRLITGLVDPERPRQFTGITAERGAYANDGFSSVASAAGPERFRSYLTTTNALSHGITAFVQSPDGTLPYTDFSVAPNNKEPRVSPLQGGGVAVTDTACREGVCQIADPANGPVIYNAGPSNIGMQLRARAVSGTGALPLVYEHAVEGVMKPSGFLSGMLISVNNSGTAHLDGNTGWAESFHGALVSHGDYLEVADFRPQG
ncbi:hypothetical protein [Streptomyces sp. NPDC008121]|uniref:hypothetical protein n=1 Tax=Streptomyces sp. NPDC008121 TaxID=3364809 RepID=UPI0036E50A33